MSDERILNIETTLAYQDDLLLVLNKTVSDQQLKIDALEKQLKMVTERVLELVDRADANTIIDEKPPHY
ncbi:MAG: SlyX family protein [Alcanivoracaceae bacterium]|jgi:SlyX protein|nr:SlyX family protein [Alcanivoracaceae bacterium]